MCLVLMSLWFWLFRLAVSAVFNKNLLKNLSKIYFVAYDEYFIRESIKVIIFAGAKINAHCS